MTEQNKQATDVVHDSTDKAMSSQESGTERDGYLIKEENQLDGAFLLDMYSNFRRMGAMLILGSLLLLIIALVVTALLEDKPTEEQIGKVGIHLLLDDGRNNWPIDIWDEHMAYAGEIASPKGIAVQVIRYDDLDSERWQVFMDLAAEHDLTPVLRLASTFDFDNRWWNAPQADANGSYIAWGEDYADFLNALNWPTAQKHVILLNEPNNGHEWGGQPDAAAYARFVADVSVVLREEVENVVILNAAFDPYAPNTGSLPFPDTDIYLVDANTFIDEMEAAQPDVFSNFDIWNSHAYALGLREHPEEQRYNFDYMHGAENTMPPFIEGLYNRGINGYEWELWKLSQLGYSELPVMITETGWRHEETTDPNSLDNGFGYPAAEQIAEFFDYAFRGSDSSYAEGLSPSITAWIDDERVLSVAPFALNGVPSEWGHTSLLKLDAEGNVMGTYAMFDMIVDIEPQRR